MVWDRYEPDHDLEMKMAQALDAAKKEIERLTSELHDCQHERDRYRAAAEQTRGSVAEVWSIEAEERGIE